jgi:PAS domain S-box-containing protein
MDKQLPILEIVEALPTGLIVVDSLGKIIFCNEEIERQFGYLRRELYGQVLDVLIPERLRAHHPEYMKSFLNSPQKRAMGEGRDLYGLQRSGREFPIEIGLNPLHTQHGLFVLAAIVDISKRRMVEEKFRSVVESSPNGLIIVNAEQVIVQVNLQAERMFGYERTQLLGQKIDVLVPVRFRKNHPSYVKSFLDNPQVRAMGSGRDLFGRRRSGEEFPIEIGLTPLTVDGKAMVLATIVDITQRKKIEQVIQLKTQEMEQFVYIVSHDLKSPIVTSLSFIQFIREDLPADTDASILDSLTRLERANRRMAQLIDDLLRLSRIGQIELQREKVDLKALVQEVWTDLEGMEKPANLAIQIEQSLPILELDSFRMRQLFENLLTNSLKYGVSHSQPIIRVGAREEDSEWLIFVKDNGNGIAPEHHQRIFGLFERLETQKEGTGVGLAIVSRVATLHGGKVWVESSPGSGATFYISIPKSPTLSHPGGL